MQEIPTPLELKKLYDSGENISAYLRNLGQSDKNTDDIIEYSYDLQSGSYISALDVDSHLEGSQIYTGEIASILKSFLPAPKSLLKVGVGECVTLTLILKHLNLDIPHVHGFDMCWSRVGYGRQWLADNGLDGVNLCSATLSQVPFADNSFDIVLSSHSLEPNGGREREILSELHRVCGNYLILNEPAYHLSDESGRERMDKHGYIKDLAGHAKQLGFNVIDQIQFKNSLNPNNPTEALVIKKEAGLLPKPEYACPVTKGPLKAFSDCFFSEQHLSAYPKIMGIPCFRKKYAVIASKLEDLNTKLNHK